MYVHQISSEYRTWGIHECLALLQFMHRIENRLNKKGHIFHLLRAHAHLLTFAGLNTLGPRVVKFTDFATVVVPITTKSTTTK